MATNYEYFSYENNVFRGIKGANGVKDVLTENGWEPYNGRVAAPFLHGTEMTKAEVDDAYNEIVID